MTGTSAPGWAIGGTALLTASTGEDSDGDGWLRLTDNNTAGNEAGYAFYDSAFDISQGAIIQYDYATWGGAGDPGGGSWGATGADGYSFFLFDGSYDYTTFSVGASGGSLGYAQKTVAPIDPGLSGGYVGIGVDEWGNFSNPTEGRIGGPGQRVNSVAIRGPYNHPSGAYYYLGGSAANIAQLSFPGQLYRPQQNGGQYRRVILVLTPVAAPNYMRIDAYLQVGSGSALTQIVNGLYTGRPTPASVKVGYAASTGGSTNYHEIRNLVIDPLPTDINLTVTNSVSSATVAPGGTLTYTVTARNYGPSLTTASNAPITDNVPSQLTNVTWTCTGSNGGSCGAASGSGNNIFTTATLPFNGLVTYTITGTVSAGTPLGTVITNTASISPPAGITDYLPSDNNASASTTVTTGTATISGTIFNDANHNGTQDAGENGATATTIGNTYYVKVYNTNDLSTLVGSATVSGGQSTYSISVPAYGNYTVILSSTSGATYSPSFATNGQWIFTSPVNYTLSDVQMSGANLTGQNFGVYNGSRISGKVINDNGQNGTAANANDGMQNASEVGLVGVTVRLANNNGNTTYDTTTTDSSGNFALFTNTASATLRIYETNPTGYVSVNFNAGTTAGTYTIASDYISFAYTRYTDYSGIVFSDAAVNSFTPATRSSNGSSITPVYFAHTFNPGSGGTVTLSTTSRSQGTWPAVVYYQDLNCSGAYNAADPVISAAVTVKAGVPLCILVKDTVPSTAANGATDQIVTRASFTYTNSIGPVTATLSVTDTTTVVVLPNLFILKSADKSTAKPGDVITYTVQVANNGAGGGYSVTLTDDLGSYNALALTAYGGAPFSFTQGTPTSSLTLGTPQYSSDGGTTYSYTPVSGGGGAPAGYDGKVTNWKIPMTGTMASGGGTFTLNYKTIVK